MSIYTVYGFLQRVQSPLRSMTFQTSLFFYVFNTLEHFLQETQMSNTCSNLNNLLCTRTAEFILLKKWVKLNHACRKRIKEFNSFLYTQTTLRNVQRNATINCNAYRHFHSQHNISNLSLFLYCIFKFPTILKNFISLQ